MRLTRLLAMAGMAYLGYRFIRDVQKNLTLQRHRTEETALKEALDEAHGRMQTLTGPGRGMTEGIADVSGSFRNVNVGRGVTGD